MSERLIDKPARDLADQFSNALDLFGQLMKESQETDIFPGPTQRDEVVAEIMGVKFYRPTREYAEFLNEKGNRVLGKVNDVANILRNRQANELDRIKDRPMMSSLV